LVATVAGLRTVALVNSGQTCVAQTRILASTNRYGEVVDALVDMVGGMTVGDPTDPRTDIGPLASRRKRDRVLEYIRSGRDDGATVAAGGTEPPYDRGWYVAPTVFTGVDNRMRIAREEIFGPVLTVIPYRDEDDAVRIANDNDYGLAGSVDRRSGSRYGYRPAGAHRHLRRQHVHGRADRAVRRVQGQRCRA
jgi:acyl-CoA reductase-like NAD-dependent aldehyde dehydrogenase